MNYLLSCADLNPINRIITFRDKIKAQLLKLRLPLLFNNNNEDHKASFTLFFAPYTEQGSASLQRRRHRSTFRTVSDLRGTVSPQFLPAAASVSFLLSRYIHIISHAPIVTQAVPHGSTKMPFFRLFLKKIFEGVSQTRIFRHFLRCKNHRGQKKFTNYLSSFIYKQCRM